MMSERTSNHRYCLRAFITDALTLSRLTAAAAVLWLGWRVGRDAFPEAILLVTAAWMSDAADGYIARHSGCRTRLGKLDYPIDVSLTWASFIFLALAGFISVRALTLYTLIAATVALWFRRKAILVLFMRGVDLTALYFALRYAFLYTLPLLIWLILLAWMHRQRLRTGVPQWLRELASCSENNPLIGRTTDKGSRRKRQ